jgi:ubiquinone/menaquinone biosynthesis C-methylase UbiE
MPEANAQFVGSIPEIYDRCLGPVLFEPYAADLVSRLKVGPAARVLELACGTGIVTRRLRDRLASGATIVATDLNEPMLAFAARKFRPGERVEWRQADACALPFPDGSVDAVVCQFGFMFVPDKPLAMREARRVLRPGGLLAFNVWGSMEDDPFALVAHETIAGFFPGDPPTFYQVPFSMHDRGELEHLVSGAGFTSVKVETVRLTGESPSARELAIGLVEGNPVVTAIKERGTVPVETIVDRMTEAVRGLAGDRPARVELVAQVVTGRAPRPTLHAG